MKCERTRLATCVRECLARPDEPVEKIVEEVLLAWEMVNIDSKVRSELKWRTRDVAAALHRRREKLARRPPPKPPKPLPLLEGLP